MKKNNLDNAYWENRYTNMKIGWDIGYPSTPIKTYIDQIEDKTLKILIPGARNSYEAEYLWNKGFANIYILDFAKQPLENLKQRISGFPEQQLLNIDFFDLDDHFDLILEQTFFCALHPNLRKRYPEKINQLLRPNGKLVGLLFDFELSESGPPFGGHMSDYKSLFESTFAIHVLERSINSIKERQGKELFFIFESP